MSMNELYALEDFVKECKWQTDGNWRHMSWDANNYQGESHCWIFIDGRYLPENFDNHNDIISYEYILSVLETGYVTISHRNHGGVLTGPEFKGELSDPNFFDNFKKALDTIYDD